MWCLCLTPASTLSVKRTGYELHSKVASRKSAFCDPRSALGKYSSTKFRASWARSYNPSPHQRFLHNKYLTLLNFPTAPITWAAKQTVCGWRCAASFIAFTWSASRAGFFSAMCRNICRVGAAVVELLRYSHSCGTLASKSYKHDNRFLCQNYL